MDVVRQSVKDSMVHLGHTQTSLAASLGISQAAVSKKMRGLSPWTIEDIDVLTELGFVIPAPRVEVSA